MRNRTTPLWNDMRGRLKWACRPEQCYDGTTWRNNMTEWWHDGTMSRKNAATERRRDRMTPLGNDVMERTSWNNVMGRLKWACQLERCRDGTTWRNNVTERCRNDDAMTLWRNDATTDYAAKNDRHRDPVKCCNFTYIWYHHIIFTKNLAIYRRSVPKTRWQ